MKEEKPELNTFDMYHFFSRIDVLLAIAVVVGLILAALFYFYGADQVV